MFFFFLSLYCVLPGFIQLCFLLVNRHYNDYKILFYRIFIIIFGNSKVLYNAFYFALCKSIISVASRFWTFTRYLVLPLPSTVIAGMADFVSVLKMWLNYLLSSAVFEDQNYDIKNSTYSSLAIGEYTCHIKSINLITDIIIIFFYCLSWRWESIRLRFYICYYLTTEWKCNAVIFVDLVKMRI